MPHETSSSITGGDSLVGISKSHNLPQPSSIGEFVGGNTKKKMGIFILPGNSESGMLENLCLQTVAKHPVIPLMEEFFVSLEKITTRRDPPDAPMQTGTHYYPSNEPKAKVQVFLAGLHEITSHVGIAAEKGIWDFENPSLATIKEFLNKLRAND
jgi:hypothetical protein